jgi:hypothetical protein
MSERLVNLANSLAEQIDRLEKTRAQLRSIEGAAESAAVRVRVDSSGSLVEVTLKKGADHVDRVLLGRMIVDLAKQATADVTKQIAARTAGLRKARDEVFDELERQDPDAAATLRRVSHATGPLPSRPPVTPDKDDGPPKSWLEPV